MIPDTNSVLIIYVFTLFSPLHMFKKCVAASMRQFSFFQGLPTHVRITAMGVEEVATWVEMRERWTAWVKEEDGGNEGGSEGKMSGEGDGSGWK